jgi:hypothetical protein
MVARINESRKISAKDLTQLIFSIRNRNTEDFRKVHQLITAYPYYCRREVP